MFSWTKPTATLAEELRQISDNTNCQRQPHVESQLLAVQNEVARLLRNWANTNRERHMTLQLDSVFCSTVNGSVQYTPTGVAFQTAMAGVLPSWPTLTERYWFAEKLIEYFKGQGLGVTYNGQHDAMLFTWQEEAKPVEEI